MNYYKDSDHQKIRDAIARIDAFRWIVSYDSSSFIKALYEKYRSQDFYLNYSANNNGKGREVLFFSDNCIISETALNKINIVIS